jgi:hypothetical protein
MTTKKKRTYTLEQRQANAKRQQQYREKHLKDEDGTKARLSAVIDHRAALALKRLAVYYGVTQTELLERLLMVEQGKVLDGLDADGQVTYYDSVTA